MKCNQDNKADIIGQNVIKHCYKLNIEKELNENVSLKVDIYVGIILCHDDNITEASNRIKNEKNA
jgi:hypothetical protein